MLKEFSGNTLYNIRENFTEFEFEVKNGHTKNRFCLPKVQILQYYH